MARQFPEALSEYFHAWRFWKAEPLLSLLLGVTYLQAAMTRKVPDRHRAVLMGFAFMQVCVGG